MTTASIHWFSRFSRRLARALGLGVGILVLGAIAPPPAPSQAGGNGQKAQTIWPLGLDQQAASLTLAPTHPILDIAVYAPGSSCMGYIPTTLTFPADQAVTAVVHHVFTNPDLALMGFDLSAYRIRQDGGAVIVDLRLPPQSPRQLVSLSVCEQQIVLGSVRKTLLENPALAVSSVQFTERGQPLSL